MKFDNLKFNIEDEPINIFNDPNYVPMSNAVVSFNNGYAVSIAQGSFLWTKWQPGLYEAMVISYHAKEFDGLYRGDSADMQKLLDTLEKLPPYDG